MLKKDMKAQKSSYIQNVIKLDEDKIAMVGSELTILKYIIQSYFRGWWTNLE